MQDAETYFDLIAFCSARNEEQVMSDSIYNVIELVGTSTESWEKAAKAAVDMAAKSLRDLRIAEVVEQDLQLKDGKVEAYRAKVKISFKYEGKH
jgi:flavin-binding protein dodecin